jgi:septal ring-binding cell division protein DamX
MRQLKERITHSFALEPLPPRDIKEYIDFRLRAAGYRGPELFGPEALRIIAEASEGLTRRINIFADKTLLAAFAAGTHTITADHARAAVSDTQIVMTRRESPRRLALVAAAAAAAGIVIGFAAGRFTASTPPAAMMSASAPVRAAVASVPPPPPPEPNTPLAPIPVAASTPAPPADPVGARVAAGRELLASGGAQFAVQLMVTDARERAYLGSYLAQAAQALPSAKIFLAEAGSADAPRYGVLYGPFAAKAEASVALNALPPDLRQFGPYVRSLESLREDARRAARQ